MSCGTVREKLLPVFYKIRGKILDDKLGFRRYRVFTRTRTPSDVRGGLGAVWTNVDVEWLEKPRIRSAQTKDVVTSGGMIKIGDYIADSITPRNDGDTVGSTPEFFRLAPTTDGQKKFAVLVGPDMPPYIEADPGALPTPILPSGGGEFSIVQSDTSHNFWFRLIFTPATGRR